MNKLETVRRQLLLLADSSTPRADRAWDNRVVWIGTCLCRTITAGAPINAPWFKCPSCRTHYTQAPYHEAIVATYTVAGWPGVVELAVQLYCDLAGGPE